MSCCGALAPLHMGVVSRSGAGLSHEVTVGKRRLVVDEPVSFGGEQRARLTQIADRCPVHRTLQGEVRVESVAK